MYEIRRIRRKQKAEVTGFEGKDIPEYVRRHQALDREERAAWRDAQRRQADIRMVEIQAEAEKERGLTKSRSRWSRFRLIKNSSLKN